MATKPARKSHPVNALHSEIKSRFDVEYIGGVGFCGPDWQAAQAFYDARKEAALDALATWTMAAMKGGR